MSYFFPIIQSINLTNFPQLNVEQSKRKGPTRPYEKILLPFPFFFLLLPSLFLLGIEHPILGNGMAICVIQKRSRAEQTKIWGIRAETNAPFSTTNLMTR
jgi:hypothetical protein